MMKNLVAGLALLLGLGLAIPSAGQLMLGKVTGTVVIAEEDAEARIPGVVVKLKNETTKVTSGAVTDDEGNFRFLVQPGENYTLTAELYGFKTTTNKRLQVRLGEPTTWNVKLKVGIAPPNGALRQGRDDARAHIPGESPLVLSARGRELKATT